VSSVTRDDSLGQAVERAKDGDRAALEEVVRAVQDDVYRLALRMTGHPEDARDACQEILVKIVTRLDAFRGESSIRTWAYQIAVRHVLDRKKSRIEALALDFAAFGNDLLDGLSPDATDDPILAQEVKLGCTLAMLTCLDRDHRIAFILSDIFDLPHVEAAAFCAVSEETHRQRLSRARRSLEAFTTSFCGLVNAEAPCRCDKRVARAEELGRIERGRPRLAEDDVIEARREIESLHTTARLLRSHPAYSAPAEILQVLRASLDGHLRVLE
jgi:RNA polymerase sigma factor (sigma-70 family)